MRASVIWPSRKGRGLSERQGKRRGWAAFLGFWLLAIVGANAEAGLLDGLFASSRDASYQIIDYRPVTKTLVAGSSSLNPQYDYAYRVEARNASNVAVYLLGSVTSTRSSVSVKDGEARFGRIVANGAALSSDTITVRAGKFFDRRLDPRITRNGQEDFEEVGDDPDDKGMPGMPPGLAKHSDAWLAAFYAQKFSSVFRWSFRGDTTSPIISSQSPKDTLVASPTTTISAQYTDENGIDVSRVVLLVDGQDVTANAQVTTGNISYLPPTKLSDGPHAIMLKIADMAGNPAELSWTFAVDALAPAIANTLPANGTRFAADAMPVISASFADAGIGVDPASMKLFVNGQDVTAATQITATTINYSPQQPLLEGSHNVRLLVADKNGNTAESSWGFVTQTAPEITVVSPKDVFFRASQSPTIAAQYQDVGSGIDVTQIRLSLDGSDVTAQAQITTQGLTLAMASPLPEGVHVLDLSIADKVGNVTMAQWQFIVDGSLPLVSAMLPTADHWTNTKQPTISANFRDAGEVAVASGIDAASIRLLFNGVDVTAQAVITADRISYVPTQFLADGEHSAMLQLADNAGNNVESAWRFRVDATSPLITNVSPADGESLAADALPTIQVTFSDAGAGIEASSIRMTLDGADITGQATVTETGIAFTAAQPLPEGLHTAIMAVADKAGNTATQVLSFKTATPPQIFAETPKDRFVPAATPPTITASYADIGAGINSTAVRMELDGVDVTAQSQVTENGISYAAPQPLQDGAHTVRLTVADKAGNQAASEWQFGTGQPPEISGQTPNDVLLPPGSQPTISAQYVDARVGINVESVRLIVNGTDVTAQASVTERGVSYTPAPLEAGPVTVYLEVGNQTNGIAQSVWGFEVDTPATYAVAVVSPAANAMVTTHKLDVRVSVVANKTYPTVVTVNGQPMRVVSVESGGVQYVATVALNDGANTLSINATYADGETRSTSTVVNYNAPPIVTITAPADKVILGSANATSPRDLTGNVERPVSIIGRVNKPVTSIMVNQQRATLSGGTEFRFDNFFLHEGTNLLTVVATDSLGRTGTSTVTVSVDQTAPILSVEHPLADSVTSSSKIDIRGVVNDAVEGFVGAPEPEVTVNGVPAQVADRYYLAADVPLQVGLNTLTVVATDHASNSRRVEFRVTRLASGTNRLTLLSGNHQKAAPNTELPKALTIVALNKNGEPLANVPVNFDVLRGTGSISVVQGQPAKPDGVNLARNLVVNTDTSGRASVWLTTGKKTGVGANVVRAYVTPGADLIVAEDVFFASTTERTLPAVVMADMGTNQYAELGTEPLEPLTAVVRDSQGNPLPNLPVTFRIEEGEAFLVDAYGGKVQSLILQTDKNGVAAVRPVIGLTPGTIRLSAKTIADPNNAESGEIGQAAFLIQGREPKDGITLFRGFVYTDKSEPMVGVRMSVGRTNLSVTTDENGAFVLENVPPGRIDLFVDARTSTFQNKQWPALHFEVVAIRGQDNQLPHPIYLPPLAMSEAKWVGGNDDVILEIPGLEGFQMKIKANSVTFPDGSHEGMLVVSPVVADRLPMSPPGGTSTFGQPAWTIQPSGTRFDPPIEVTMPNVAGMKPGDTAPVVQWDHDLAQYVAMGRATVTEDGAFLVTDAGTGISKAGWGGCVECPPPPPKPRCAKNTGSCKECQELDATGDCPSCKDKESCKDDPRTETISADFPEKEPLKDKLTGIMRAIPFISTLNLGIQGSGTKTLGKECCKEPAREKKCLGPYRYEEVAGRGSINAQIGLGPSILNPKFKEVIPWGVDAQLIFAMDITVNFVSATGSVAAQALTKNGSCPESNCKAYSIEGSIGFRAGEVKFDGKAALESLEGKKWETVMGVGFQATGFFDAGSIRVGASQTMTGCPLSNTPSYVKTGEIAIEGTVKLTVQIPGVLTPTIGYTAGYRQVLVPAMVF